MKEIQNKLTTATKSTNPNVQRGCELTSQSVGKLAKFLEVTFADDPAMLQVAARDFAFSLARCYMASLLLEQAAWDEAMAHDATIAVRWCEQDLIPAVTNHSYGYYDKKNIAMDTSIVMDGYTNKPLSKM
uniref:Uncharacterized protein LOC100377336 n=1 Tax=Saccoglossus kowalevskii TaxID=10224 RepID=A0ABM0GU88_SACKO|nr:PREDICTED: uncharacterized protein LOC100377336 [Saccoglossus kowalevskii]